MLQPCTHNIWVWFTQTHSFWLNWFVRRCNSLVNLWRKEKKAPRAKVFCFGVKNVRQDVIEKFELQKKRGTLPVSLFNVSIRSITTTTRSEKEAKERRRSVSPSCDIWIPPSTHLLVKLLGFTEQRFAWGCLPLITSNVCLGCVRITNWFITSDSFSFRECVMNMRASFSSFFGDEKKEEKRD